MVSLKTQWINSVCPPQLDQGLQVRKYDKSLGLFKTDVGRLLLVWQTVTVVLEFWYLTITGVFYTAVNMEETDKAHYF